jgi:malonate-semialdehyde dehydrogenase (acetylating)/methylmalonate-semialdehyde dehydrogenase
LLIYRNIIGFQEIEKGAEAVLDGRNMLVPEYPQGYVVGPTVLDQVHPEMHVYREEICGPVVGMIPVPTLDEAIALIHANAYGNAASIFPCSGFATREFRYRAEAGTIGITVGVAAPVAYFPSAEQTQVVLICWAAGDGQPVTGVGR